MRQVQIEPDWQQHFPTYRFTDRDIVIEEYRWATRTLEAEEKVFLSASNLTLVVGAGLVVAIVGSFDRVVGRLGTFIPTTSLLTGFLLLTALFVWTTLKYFADRQRAIVFAARKVIVLRRMLGLDYGHLQLVLPNWRAEGAGEPFAVRMFPGWATYAAYPFWVVTGFSALVVFVLGSGLAQSIPVGAESTTPDCPTPSTLGSAAVSVWVALFTLLYRSSLLDSHERVDVLFTRLLARVLRVGIEDNFEYILYGAKLAKYEIQRVRIDMSPLKHLLVAIEDRTFYTHHGVSLRGVVRAGLGLVGLKRRSGGSTITQQLARTLFIRDLHKLIRRKIVEIMLALWLDRVLPKEFILEVYLAAVRFETRVYGVVAAMRHFFGDIIWKPTDAQAFLLIERVSNVRSGVLTGKIIQKLRELIEREVITPEEARKAAGLYVELVKEGKLASPGEESLVCLMEAMKAA